MRLSSFHVALPAFLSSPQYVFNHQFILQTILDNYQSLQSKNQFRIGNFSAKGRFASGEAFCIAQCFRFPQPLGGGAGQ
jgi:hypothetical protein